MQKQSMRVEGIPEVTRAFDQVERDVSNLQDAHRAEAEMLLPDVRGATRRDKGTLQSAWSTDSTDKAAQFINDEEYAGVQEWGWDAHNIEPTLAITQAFERNQGQTEEVYAKAVKDAADKANIRTD